MRKQMKNKILIYPLMAMAFIAILTSSCKKDETTTSSGSYHFTCKVDGVAFAVTKHMSDGNGVYANVGGEQVNAQNQKESSFTLGIDGLAIKGATTYTPSSSYQVFYSDENGVSWHYKSGSFIVTKYDAAKFEVTGTFSSIILESDAGATKTATDGSFYVYLVH
jgi:hypothetical protein